MGLWRNWKGYLVWREPARCATTARPGYLLQVLTGERAGEREWRSQKDFESSPTVAPGLPRYEPVVDPMPFCPLVQAQTVFRQEFLDAPAVPIYWLPPYMAGAYGECQYLDGKPDCIFIRPDVKLGEAVSVLLHELAHTVVEPEWEIDRGHGPNFHAALERLEAAYERRQQLLVQIDAGERKKYEAEWNK